MYILFMFSMDDLHEQIYKDRKTTTFTYFLVYKRKDIEKIKKKDQNSQDKSANRKRIDNLATTMIKITHAQYFSKMQLTQNF